ncbi:GNAT family N-acetyltransferase [Bacillus sp. AFS015802]|uniref:GNAT family N-acetyltransferase n=1 Tax=Bacillus sp. AFS015802 TaxID=2033486 RepID=UPI000BF67976|nr:GNAT family N-acetyltransferase [Bacillus sp. AFS015802]PFA70489.1 GNAT family N-acetyltransferase [Bacillus sp. AFS015802]
MHYRKAEIQDAEGLAHVHVHSWRTTYSGIVSGEYLQSLSIAERKNKWIGILSGPHHTYVCEREDGKIVGFVSFGKERTGDYEGELYALYLLKEHQGKGIGEELFGIATSGLRNLGFTTMWIWVLKENPSKHFYYKYKSELIKEKILTIGNELHREEGLLLKFK